MTSSAGLVASYVIRMLILQNQIVSVCNPGVVFIITKGHDL